MRSSQKIIHNLDKFNGIVKEHFMFNNFKNFCSSRHVNGFLLEIIIKETFLQEDTRHLYREESHQRITEEFSIFSLQIMTQRGKF